MHPYTTSLDAVLRVRSQRLSLVDGVIAKLCALQSCGAAFSARLSASSRALPTANGVVDWLQRYALSPDALSVFACVVAQRAAAALRGVRAAYERDVGDVAAALSRARAPYDEASERYFSAYESYLSACHSLERDPAGAARAECPALEAAAVARMEELRLAKRRYAAAAEAIMLSFERAERAFYGGFRSALSEYASVHSALARACAAAAADGAAALRTIGDCAAAPRVAFCARTLPQSLAPRTAIRALRALPPSAVFGCEIAAEYLVATQIFFPQQTEETELRKGDVLQVLPGRKDATVVRNLRTGLIGRFGSGALRQIAAPFRAARTVYRAKRECPPIEEGEMAFAFSVAEGRAQCVTSSGEIASLPVDALEECECR